MSRPTTDYFAVLDTETNYNDKVYSVGVVVADKEKMLPVKSLYCVIPKELEVGAMFADVTYSDTCRGDENYNTPSKDNMLNRVRKLLEIYQVKDIFAYNANFDMNHLPELESSYNWIDIMRIAAYKDTNKFLTKDMDYFSTGRLKNKYSVEDILNLIEKTTDYSEVHNAISDAIDELKLTKLLDQPYETFIKYGNVKKQRPTILPENKQKKKDYKGYNYWRSYYARNNSNNGR